MIKREPGDLRQTITHRITQRGGRSFAELQRAEPRITASRR